MRITTLILALIGLNSLGIKAQCPAGQLEVRIDVTTDQWGYECYWELVPGGTPCGLSTIFAGGNTTELQCGLTGTATPGNGYGNNTTISEGPWCLTEDATFEIEARDAYGDGGSMYTVKIESYPVYMFTALDYVDEFTFINSMPPALDASMLTLETMAFMEIGSIDIVGDIENLGTTAITSLDVNYSIDNGPTVTDALTGLNIAAFAQYNFTHSTPWVPSASGDYELKVWVSNVNGAAADSVPANDMITKQLTIIGQIPNIIASYALQTNTFNYLEIGNLSDGVKIPMDLDFHPNGELWVVNLGIWNGTGASGGTTITFYNPGKTGQQALYRKDSNSKHFMAKPSGIAFSLNGNFATSPSVYDANDNGGTPFTGPALWSSDSLIYAQPSGGNGSHLDMLHMSPYAMGIANEKDNIFWVFDSESNDIVKYDFASDHGPGNTDHDDGKVYRYEDVVVDRIDLNTACHLAFDDDKKWLYIVDAGSLRVIRMDITTGTISGTAPSFTNYDGLATYKRVDGATQEVVVSTGLVKPSGIAILEDRMLVSDNSTGEIIIYDISSIPATEMNRLQTGSAGVMGITIGPEGRIWYVNAPNNTLNKIEPDNIISTTPTVISSVQSMDVSCNGLANGSITITATGWGTLSYSIDGGSTFPNTTGLFTGLGAGSYTIAIQDVNGIMTGSTVIINDPAAISIVSESATDKSSCGTDDGEITLVANGGTPPLSYSIDGGITFANTTGLFTGLSAGNYDIAIQDASGCPKTGSTLTINDISGIVITSEATTNATACGVNDGTIIIVASDTTGSSLSYSIDGGSTFPNTDGVFTGLSKGIYNVVVNNANLCEKIGSTLTISDPSTVSGTISATPDTSGTGVGTATISSVGGGSSPYTYSWSSGSSAFNATGLTAGTYTVTVTDANGCTYVSSITVGAFNVTNIVEIADLISRIKIYPNPTSGFVYVEMEGMSDDRLELTIIDMLGKSVYSSEFTKEQAIDVSQFANGIYYLVLTSSSERAARKLVVSH